MASIANRSPWVVTCPNQPEKKFRLKSQAKTHYDSLNNPKAKMVQLATAFEVQIKLKDKDGNTVFLTKTCPTEAEAEKWAKDEEARLLEHKRQNNGKFDTSQETMTLGDGLQWLLDNHYIKMRSYEECKYRVPYILQYFGKHKLIKEITKRDASAYNDYLKEKGYAPSSIRSNFSILSMLYKKTASKLFFTLPNPTEGVELDPPDNAIERYWETKDEKEKLLSAIEEHRPQLKRLVLICLDLTFRIGELIPKAVEDQFGNPKNEDKGLFWANVDFENNEIRLTHEKNDHTKRNTELKGRIVPLTNFSKRLLLEIYKEQGNPKPTDRVFPITYNTVYRQLKFCCDKAGIKNFTWHSTRKIACVDVGKKMKNVFQAAEISGHKTIQVFYDRYWKSPIEDLKAMLDEIDTENPILRGFLVLEKHLGRDLTEEFVKFVQRTKTEKDKSQTEQLKAICEEPALEEVSIEGVTA